MVTGISVEEAHKQLVEIVENSDVWSFFEIDPVKKKKIMGAISNVDRARFIGLIGRFSAYKDRKKTPPQIVWDNSI